MIQLPEDHPARAAFMKPKVEYTPEVKAVQELNVAEAYERNGEQSPAAISSREHDEDDEDSSTKNIAAVVLRTHKSAPEHHSPPTKHIRKALHNRSISSPPIIIPTPLQRRVLFKYIAEQARNGCLDALTIIQSVSAHAKLSARGGPIFDPTFTFNGYLFRYSQLGAIEWAWIKRYLIVEETTALFRCKRLNEDDVIMIERHFFPTQERDLLSPEHFSLFLDNLVHEDMLDRAYATKIKNLSLTLEQFRGGAAAMSSKKPSPSVGYTTMFTQLPYRAGPARSAALRRLMEAAVYGQQIWKGGFYADALSKLNDYLEAWDLTTRKCVSTPPHLTEYKRNWTYVEERSLRRVETVADLIARWKNGSLLDYGILKAVRGTFVPISGQAYYDTQELESFLYSRVMGSGLAIREIPRILALHADHDEAFRDVRAEERVVAGLTAEMREFERGEEERLSAIERQRQLLKAATKTGKWAKSSRGWRFVTDCVTERTKFQRLADRLKKLFRKAPVLQPFDPFQQR